MTVSRVEKQIGGQTLSIETGKLAKQAHGAVGRQYGDTVVLVAAVEGAAPGGPRLLPSDGRLSREDLRRRQVPRRLHQARRPAHHQGNPDLPPDRPAHPPALPGRLSQRSPGHGLDALRRSARTIPMCCAMIGASAALHALADSVPRGRPARSASAASAASSSSCRPTASWKRAIST